MPCGPASLEDCCTLDGCAAHLGGGAARPRVRVGTTPGFRDEPVNVSLKFKRYEQMPNAQVEWVQCPGDLDAVTAMLNAGLVDVAMMFSEDAVLQAATWGSLRVCGMLSGRPRRWSIIVPSGFCRGPVKLGRCNIAIPPGLGGKLMTAIMQECSACWECPTCIEHTTFVDALCSLIKRCAVKAVLWDITAQEQSTMTATFQGVCETAHEMLMPWPSHLFLASRETLRAKLETIRSFLSFSNLLSEQLRAKVHRESLDYFWERYDLYQEEVECWLQAAGWGFCPDVDAAAVEGPLACLEQLQLLPPGRGAREPARCLAPGARLLGRPAGPAAAEEEAEAPEEASASCLPASRLHSLLPRPPGGPRAAWGPALLGPRALLRAISPPESPRELAEALRDAPAGPCTRGDGNPWPVPAG
mmetsp:Transcript_49701/g.153626  ORF Transcript_49701/g.153626 Transcript_49701/m.153626 type:complete len:415 (+) Transcript_49701:115-1359(+)